MDRGTTGVGFGRRVDERPEAAIRGDRRTPDDHGEGQPPSGRRELVLDALRASPHARSIASLAEQLRVHPNTVRFHLGVLQRSGQVELAPGVTTGPGRPPTLFRATRRMDPAGPTNYRLLATMLTSQLAASPEPAIAATSLGRAWGHRLVGPPRPRRSGVQVRRAEALHRMMDMLDGLGFAPAAPTGPRDTVIRIRHCPFLGVVNDPSGLDGERGGYGTVICALHLGVMQGALAALDAPVTVDRLDPLVEPDLCVAHLGPAKAGGDATAGGTTAHVRAST